MNLSPIQERRLLQVQNEIAFLEKEAKKKNAWFAIWLSGIAVFVSYLVGYFIDWAMDGTSVPDYVKANGWLRILSGWVFWFLTGYFFFVRSIHQNLKIKKKELAGLKIRYGLHQETVS